MTKGATGNDRVFDQNGLRCPFKFLASTQSIKLSIPQTMRDPVYNMLSDNNNVCAGAARLAVFCHRSSMSDFLVLCVRFI